MDKAENVMVTITKERYDFHIAEIERLRQQNAELIEALRPFAALGKMLLPADERDDSVFVTMPDDTPIRNVTLSNFTAGDFRKAAKATGDE